MTFSLTEIGAFTTDLPRNSWLFYALVIFREQNKNHSKIEVFGRKDQGH